MSLCVFFPVLFKRDGICITDQLLMQIQKSFVISQQFFHLFGANEEATIEQSRDGKTKKQKPKMKRSHPENSSTLAHDRVETLPVNDSRVATGAQVWTSAGVENRQGTKVKANSFAQGGKMVQKVDPAETGGAPVMAVGVSCSI